MVGLGYVLTRFAVGLVGELRKGLRVLETRLDQLGYGGGGRIDSRYRFSLVWSIPKMVPFLRNIVYTR